MTKKEKLEQELKELDAKIQARKETIHFLDKRRLGLKKDFESESEAQEIINKLRDSCYAWRQERDGLIKDVNDFYEKNNRLTEKIEIIEEAHKMALDEAVNTLLSMISDLQKGQGEDKLLTYSEASKKYEVFQKIPIRELKPMVRGKNKYYSESAIIAYVVESLKK